MEVIIHLFHSINTILSAREKELAFLLLYLMGRYPLMLSMYIIYIKTLQDFNYFIALKF